MEYNSPSTAIIKITPISGARQEWAPSCYLLEIDQARILLDIGCGECFEIDEYWERLRKIIMSSSRRSVDMILLSHGDMAHCGALPLWLKEGGRVEGPILATVPSHHYALVTLYDAFQSFPHTHGDLVTPPVNLDDVDNAFEQVTTLRYSQSYTVTSGPATGIQVTPIAAGHSLGGSIWRIRKHTEEIFYAIDFNHKKEIHLEGAALDVVQRPALLIADSKGALEVHQTRKQRDSSLFEAISPSLKANGTVLLPVSSAGRTLELLQIIQSQWILNKISDPVYFLSHQSQRVIDLAKGMLEWSSQSMMKIFENDRTNPYDLPQIKFIHSLAELPDHDITGRVIIASLASLNSGHSRQLLPQIIEGSNNSIIFTEKTSETSLAGKILSMNKNKTITLEWYNQVPMEGEELVRYLREAKEEKERLVAEQEFAKLQMEHKFTDDEEEEGEGNGENSSIEQSEDRRNKININKAQAAQRRLEQEQITSAQALRDFYWTDYRNDWQIDKTSFIAKYPKQAINSPFYPLIPPHEQRNNSSTMLPLRYQSFPFREHSRPADVYGEFVDLDKVNNGKQKGKSESSRLASVLEAVVPLSPINTTTEETSTFTASEDSVPMKWEQRIKDVVVKAQRKCLSLSGISDGRSLKTIYMKIQPRRLVLVGGSDEGTEYLYGYLHQQLKSSELYSPRVGETVELASAVNVMQVVLAESLIPQIRMTTLGEYEVGWIKGKFRQQGDLMDIDEGHNVASPSVTSSHSTLLTIVPASDEDVDQAQPIMVGDPRLSEIRRLIQSDLRISAEFIEGDLVCGRGANRIRVFKDTISGNVGIEGPLCNEYYAVRSVIYSLTALLY